MWFEFIVNLFFKSFQFNLSFWISSELWHSIGIRIICQHYDQAWIHWYMLHSIMMLLFCNHYDASRHLQLLKVNVVSNLIISITETINKRILSPINNMSRINSIYVWIHIKSCKVINLTYMYFIRRSLKCTIFKRIRMSKFDNHSNCSK